MQPGANAPALWHPLPREIMSREMLQRIMFVFPLPCGDSLNV
jgi:hypothetical protein